MAVRSALLGGMDGYSCLVDAGQTAVPEIEEIVNRRQTSTYLDRLRIALKTELDDPNAPFLDRERAVRANDNAVKALELFRKQDTARRGADRDFRAAARKMSIGLLRRVERQEVDFEAVFQSLAKKASSVAQFKVEKADAEPGPADPMLADDNAVKRMLSFSGRAASAPQLRGIVSTVEALTAKVLADLPNMEASVASFGECAAKGLTGGGSS